MREMTFIHTKHSETSECDKEGDSGVGARWEWWPFLFHVLCRSSGSFNHHDSLQKMFRLLYHILLTCYSHTLTVTEGGVLTHKRAAVKNFTDGHSAQA